MYTKTTNNPRRTNLTNIQEPKVITQLGYTVSVDQLTTPTPGLIAQMTEQLTNK